ncbi:MAG: NmrA family NAD(P)-binding protein [Gemmatimonadetes bacterium]|nr:NmrA family NAD(P)-binding protein [Gemmatimonadota bacterium]
MSNQKIIAVFGATGAQGGGLAHAIAADPASGFVARAITRNPNSDKAKALAAAGIEVAAADTDDAASLGAALAGAYGAFCVTNFWEHFSADREGVQAANMALATKAAGIEHVIWSTLEDTRKWIPLDDTRLPTLHGKFKCPHFDSKGQMDELFAAEAAPTTYLMAAFYWDNLIHFGMGPRKNDDGSLTLALPLGGVNLPGIAAADIGRVAYGIFRQGKATIGQRIGIAGESLSGAEMAAKLGRAIGQTISFFDVPFDMYRGFGFPGAEDLGNMFQFQQILGDEFQRYRDPVKSRALHPGLLDFDAWLARHAKSITIA